MTVMTVVYIALGTQEARPSWPGHRNCEDPSEWEEGCPWPGSETNAGAVPLSASANCANFKRALQSYNKKLSYRKETVRLLHNIEIRILH